MNNIEDIKNFMQEGLPIAAHWNTGGFVFDWHVEKIKAGNRMIPSIKYNVFPSTQPTSLPPKLKPENETFLRENGLPICLRTDNIPQNFTNDKRLPEVEASIPISPLVWSKVETTTPSGTVVSYKDEGICDPFADVSLWSTLGQKWGSTNYVTQIQQRFPNAAYVVIADNNESNYDNPTRYLDTTFDKYNKIACDKYGNRICVWKSQTILPSLSVRTAEYAKTHSVEEYTSQFYTNRNQQYKALYDGFNNALTPWKGRLYSEGYKIGGQSLVGGIYNPGLDRYNMCGGGQMYVSSGAGADFTSSDYFKMYNNIPRYEYVENINPVAHVREVFLSLAGGAAYKSCMAGIHDFITPELYAAHIQWLMWSQKGVKRPLMLRYWIGNAWTPSTPIFSAAQKADLESIGKSEYANLTEEDYYGAVLKSINLVCEHPVLRDFWQNGVPVVTGKHPENEILQFTFSTPIEYPPIGYPDNRWRLLDCSLNTPRENWIRLPKTNAPGGYNPISIKVWGTATELNGAYLCHFWTPCTLTGKMTFTLPVGVYEIDVPKNNSYCIVYKNRVLTLDEYVAVKETEKVVKIKLSWTPASIESSLLVKQSFEIFKTDINGEIVGESTVIELDKEAISVEFDVEPNVRYSTYILSEFDNTEHYSSVLKEFIVVNGTIKSLEFIEPSNIKIEKVENA